MFSKWFLISTITLFALVHFIACTPENIKNQPSTAKAPRRRISSSGFNGDELNEDSLKSWPKSIYSRRRNVGVEPNTDLDPFSANNDDVIVNYKDYANPMGFGTPYQGSAVVDLPEVIKPRRASRTKRATPKTSPSINKKTSTPNIDEENSTRPSGLQSSTDNDQENHDSLPEVSKSDQENSSPEQPLRKKPVKIGSIAASETNDKKRTPKLINITAKRPKNTTPQDMPIIPTVGDLFTGDSSGEAISTMGKTGLQQSIKKYFDDNWPKDEPESIDKPDDIEKGDSVYESGEQSDEPLILTVLKIISKCLKEMLSALKDVLQKSM